MSAASSNLSTFALFYAAWILVARQSIDRTAVAGSSIVSVLRCPYYVVQSISMQ